MTSTPSLREEIPTDMRCRYCGTEIYHPANKLPRSTATDSSVCAEAPDGAGMAHSMDECPICHGPCIERFAK